MEWEVSRPKGADPILGSESAITLAGGARCVLGWYRPSAGVPGALCVRKKFQSFSRPRNYPLFTSTETRAARPRAAGHLLVALSAALWSDFDNAGTRRQTMRDDRPKDGARARGVV